MFGKIMETSKILYFTLSTVILLIAFPVFKGFDSSFWPNVVSGMIATMFGIIVGLPFALYINRVQEQKIEAKESQARKEKQVLLLESLANEIRYNLEQINIRSGNFVSLPQTELKDDLWKAYMASGQLSIIDDSEVISELSSTYGYITRVRTLEAMCFNAIRGINVVYPDGENASQKLLKDARAFDTAIKNSVMQVLATIEEKKGPKQKLGG